MVTARTCAMAFNRIVDRKFDALNPRTADGICPPAPSHSPARGRLHPERRMFVGTTYAIDMVREANQGA